MFPFVMNKEKDTKKKKIGSSLRIQIALLYMVLAITNIIFFSVIIFENQTDLLTDNFKLNSQNFVKTIFENLQQVVISGTDVSQFDKIKMLIKAEGIEKYQIFDSNGRIILSEPETDLVIIDEAVLKKSKDISTAATTSVYTSRYSLELNEKDFSLNFLIPLKAEKEQNPTEPNVENLPLEKKPLLYLYASLSIESIHKRLNQLYFQIGLSVIWGILFHVLFGIFVYKVIFKRIGLLREASDKMGEGDLKSRAQWKFDREDELDDLGAAFNKMAVKIEETINTITKLNDEISSELKIGKEVQELFLPSNKKYKNFKMTTSYRPMREVSGDIYHFFKLTRKKRKARKHYTAIFLADASGHGVSAALVTTVILLSLENILAKTFFPRTIITQLANVVSNRFQASFFATAVFFLINEKGHIVSSNAGHNAPMLYRPSTGELEMLPSGGPPLGMAEDFPYKIKRSRPKSGDKLFIYTDGLVESPGKDEEQFSEERVINIIKENINAENKQLLSILSQRLDEFAIEYRDDVSMILMEIP